MDRRRFLGVVGAGTGVATPFGLRALDATLAQEASRYALPLIPEASGANLTLTAGRSMADIGPGRTEAWTLNGSLPAPTVRLRRGQAARIQLRNELPEPTILHWHGLNVPEAADGHPRLQIDPG